MNLSEYQKLAMRTATPESDITCAALGIFGETGEVVEILKKHLYQRRNLDVDRMIDELGDVLWYVALMARELNIDLKDCNGGVPVEPETATAVAMMGVYAGEVFKVITEGARSDTWYGIYGVNLMLISIACVARSLGVTLGEVAERNVQKLQERYPK